MGTELNDSYFQPASNPKKHLDFKYTLNRYLYHWPLFVIFIVLLGAGAYVFNLYEGPVYLASATLLINDSENKSKDQIALKDIDQTDNSKGADTEIEILTSSPLVGAVVEDLQLATTYKQRGKYIDHDLYGRSPVRFTLLKPNGDTKFGSFEITIINARQFEILESNKRKKLFHFNQKLISPFGTWQLDTTGRFNNYIGRTIIISMLDPDGLTSIYQNKIKATSTDKTPSLINLSLEDEVPERGRDFLDYLISEYHRQTALKKKQTAKKTLDFIDNRLSSLTGELTSKEKDVQAFKSSRGITDLSENSKDYVDNFQTNEKTLNDINIQLQQVSRVENYINSDDSSDPPAIHDINDVALSSLVEKLTDAQLERNKMLASIPEQNPAYAPLNKQIKSLKDLIKTNISQIKDGLQARKSQLQKASSAYESTIKNVPGQERELGGIKRQQSIKEELYIYLLQKREEIGLDYAATIPTASTIEAASYYQKPSKGPYITAIAFFLGLLIPAGMIYGRDFLNDKIVDKKDLEYNTNVPVISEIILDENSSPELILNKTRYILGEQFRDLRTKLNSLFPKERKGRVILLTSSIPSEGKSFLAANLGATLAVSNKKTIILELDLRLPKISKIINLNSDHAGIADYLNNQAKPEDIIQPSGIHPCMDIIGTGTLPDNPTELLGSEKMAELIKLLKSKYDYVLIDTPPIHLVTDAKIIAGFCDLTLYAVRQNITPKSEMEFINTTLVEQSLPHMYLIFNGVQEAGRFRYGYRLNYNYYLKSPKSGTSSFKDFFSRF